MMSVFGFDSVIERCENHVVAYLAVVANHNTSVVLKMATGIYEHILSDMDVLSKISIKRRKHPQSAWHLIAEQA